jgi:hypothetical protein
MVVRTVDSAGQLVTVGAQDVMVEVMVVKMVEVVISTEVVVVVGEEAEVVAEVLQPAPEQPIELDDEAGALELLLLHPAP